MESSRRRFLKLAGISAVGLTTKPVLNAFAAGHGGEEHPEAVVKADVGYRWPQGANHRI